MKLYITITSIYTGFKQNGIRLIIQTCRSRLRNDSSFFVNGNWRHHCVTAIDTDFQRFSWFRTFFFSYTSSFNQKIKQLNSGDKYCELQHFVLFFISGAQREKRASGARWVNKSTHPKLNWGFLKTIKYSIHLLSWMKIVVSVNVLPNYISLLIVGILKSVIFIASPFVFSRS